MTGKHVVILHGLKARPASNWYPNVAHHFRQIGYEVEVPALPFPAAPNLNRWAAACLALIQQKQWPLDETLSLVCHSTGCLAALRLAEQLAEETTLGPLVLLAGFPAAVLPARLPTIFVARKPHLERLRGKFQRVLAVHSTNDWRVPLTPNMRWFQEHFGAETYSIPNAGHFLRREGWEDWPPELYQRVEEFLAGRSV